MGLMPDGDFGCLSKKLLKPATRVLNKDLETLKVEEIEDRVHLWNQIKENIGRFEDGECGEFSRDIEEDAFAQFTMAQLKLAVSFKKNGEDFPGANRFSDKEIELVDFMESFNSFDLKEKDDIIREIHNRDEGTLGYIKAYGSRMAGGLDDIINDPKIKLPVRMAFKKILSKRADKLDDAVKESINLFGVSWFEKEAGSHIEVEVKRATTEIENRSNEVLNSRLDEIDEVAKGFEEKEEKIKIRESEITEKEREAKDRLDQIKGAIEGGGDNRLVERSEAKMAELNYIGRFDQKIGKARIKFHNSIEGGDIRISSWDKHEKGDDRGAVEKFHGSLSRSEIDNEMPVNRVSAHVLFRKKLGLLKTQEKSVVVEARVWNHLDSFANLGLDSKPMSTDEVAGLLDRAVDSAEVGRFFHVLGIASSTGFSESVVSYVASEDFHRNFVSMHVSICLVDLETGDIFFNKHDEKLKPFLQFFEKEFDVEKVEKCKEFIQKRLEVDEYVVLTDVVGEGFAREIVKKAFYELENKDYKVRFIKDVGLVVTLK